MKTIKKIGLTVALISSIAAISSAQASIFEINNASSQGGEFFEDVFFGGAFGLSDADSYCGTSSSCKEDDTTWKVYAGYKLNETFDAEVSYNGIGDLNREGGNGRETSELSSLAISAVGKYEVNDSVEAFGKLGVTRWTSSNNDNDQDGIGLNYGFGAKIHMNETMKLRAEWETISDVETTGGRKTDVTTMSLGIELETL